MFYYFIKFISSNRVCFAIYKKVKFAFNWIRRTNRAKTINPWIDHIYRSQSLVLFFPLACWLGLNKRRVYDRS